MNIEFLIPIMVFAAMMLALVGIYLIGKTLGEKREFQKRLAGIERNAEPGLDTGNAEDEKGYFLFLERIGQFLLPKKDKSVLEMRRLFLRAGYRNPRAQVIFFGLKVLLALSFFAATFLGRLFFWQQITPTNIVYIAFVLTIVGFYLPNLWIKWRIANRQGKVQLGLPDALDLMVVCVEAGTGLDSALNRTATEMRKTNRVLAEELAMVTLEIRAGKTRQEALKNLAWRTDLEDVSNLTTLLIQTERFGTSIAQALRVHSDFMRTKRFQRAEELAQKMPVKLIFPLALFVFPMLFLVVLGPALASMMKFFDR